MKKKSQKYRAFKARLRENRRKEKLSRNYNTSFGRLAASWGVAFCYSLNKKEEEK